MTTQTDDIATQPEDDDPEALAGAEVPTDADGVAEPDLPAAEPDEDEQP